MLDDLRRTRFDAQTRRSLARTLRRTRRIWPLADSEEFQRAVDLAGSPPALSYGATLLACVSDPVDGGWASASLHHLRIGSPGAIDPDATPFAARMTRVWDEAAIALSRSLPLVWRALHEVHQTPRAAGHLVTRTFADRTAHVPEELGGDSFGLSFALAMASMILEAPVPEEFVASAAVGPSGAVEAVDGLDVKVAVIEAEAPRVGKILVARANESVARAAVRRLVVVAVRNLGEAIEIVFGAAFEEFLQRSSADATARGEIVDSFFRIAMGGRGTFVDWSPVERGAAAVLGWRSLDEVQRFKVALARAVAGRHERNRGSIPVPKAAVLDAFPRAMRVAIATHIVQQCADSDSPESAGVEGLVRDLGGLVPVREAFPSQLRLRGAWARLRAVTGFPGEALAIQEEIARIWLDLLEYEETSFQLSEWCRLAGALKDRNAFRRAGSLHERVARLGGLGLKGNVYVELARAKAMVLLSITDDREVQAALARLTDDGHAPAHVVQSALRWAALAAYQGGDEAAAEGLLARLERSPERGRNGFGPEVHLALARAERAWDRGDHAEAARQLDVARAADPGPVQNLLHAASCQGQPGIAYVCRFYPY